MHGELTKDEQEFLRQWRRDFARARTSFREFEKRVKRLGPERVAQLTEAFEHQLIEQRRFRERLLLEVEGTRRWNDALRSLFERGNDLVN
jgi:hypothetical protein